jgi:uncharacterized membrane protein YkoI
MKTRLIGISAACALIVGTGSFQARADRVPLTQVPDAVQRAIKQQSQGEPLEYVDRETKDGQTVYQAEFKREGLNRHVTFAADGSIVPDKGLGQTFRQEPSMMLNELPAAVQKTVKEQQAGREIADIDREMWNGKAVYEVEFKEKGPNSRIHVASDGSMIVDKDRKSAYLGTQLSEAPAPVQATVKRVVSSAEVQDVDREARNGQVVYDVEIKQEGLNRHLKIAENGTLISDSNDRGSTTIGQRVRERVRIDGDRDASTMALEQVPPAVQKTIRENCDVGALKPIKREIRDGRVQYDVEYEKEGKNLRLTIADDGSIVKDNR